MNVSSFDDTVLLRKALSEGIRLDGRSLHEEREVELSLSRSDNGSICECLYGQTRVVSVTRGEIVAPFPDRPNDGILQFSANISPESEKAGFSDIELSRMLDRAIKESESIDTESLCIVAGEKVWSIVCSINVLDYHGNIVDACILAAMASLRTYRKPEVTITRTADQTQEGDIIDQEENQDQRDLISKVIIHSSDEREPLPLALHHTPLTVSFAVYKGLLSRESSTKVKSGDDDDDDDDDDGDGGGLNSKAMCLSGGSSKDVSILLIDPSAQEEIQSDSKISFSINGHFELCSVLKLGGAGMISSEVIHASRIAMKRAAALHGLLAQALQAFEVEAATAKARRLEILRQRFMIKAKNQAKAQGLKGQVDSYPEGQPDLGKILDYGFLHEAAVLTPSIPPEEE